MIKKTLLFLLVVTFLFGTPKYPSLNNKDVVAKSQEILSKHATYKSINQELAKRILLMFLEELDPGKIYFTEPEILPYITPTEKTLGEVIESFQTGKFTLFEKIYQEMPNLIQRRVKIEKNILQKPLPKVSLKENFLFKNTEWPKNEEEMENKMLKIRALQDLTIKKISKKPEDAKLFFENIEKRLKRREAEMMGSPKEIILRSSLLKAFAKSLDAHTHYFTPLEAKDFMIQIQQRLFGIGAQLRDHNNGLQIVRLVEKGPAFKSLKIHDLIIAVDGEPIAGLNSDEAVDKIRGKKGTPVRLTILREEKNHEIHPFDITLIRGEVIFDEKRLETSLESFGDGVIATCRLYSFYQDPHHSSMSDLKDFLEKTMKNYSLKGVILDLRDNAGGLLPQAVEVAGLFIKKGIVASIKYGEAFPHHLRNTQDQITYTGPLIVLVNRTTASASEIVAQALQDYGRAIVVGDPFTFGKGSFQAFTLDTIHDESEIDTKGEYKVTQGKYYTVSGKTPQLVGVKSDIEIPGIFSKLDIGEKFEKYPLINDSIPDSFDDKLEDIPLFQRNQMALLYKHNLQEKITIFTQYEEILKKNSEARLKENLSYQALLRSFNSHESDLMEDPSLEHPLMDFQWEEAKNITKDLVFLIEISKSKTVSLKK